MELQQDREMPIQNWREQAACRYLPPPLKELFFPGDLHKPKNMARASKAKKICNGDSKNSPCPVKNQCLAFSIKNDLTHGIYGGMIEDDRRKFTNRLKKRRDLEGFLRQWLYR